MRREFAALAQAEEHRIGEAAPQFGFLRSLAHHHLRARETGKHNVMNATAALIALTTLGFDPNTAARALSAFSGVGRRFEFAGEAAGVTVIRRSA